MCVLSGFRLGDWGEGTVGVRWVIPKKYVDTQLRHVEISGEREVGLEGGEWFTMGKASKQIEIFGDKLK
ncbi:MAG: hypothetical protein D6765_15620 [Bacteroidetes bacterium]|nr:MAG: hypothetical protein D6765_15620 [Bacteroidota bacterium]